MSCAPIPFAATYHAQPCQLQRVSNAGDPESRVALLTVHLLATHRASGSFVISPYLLKPSLPPSRHGGLYLSRALTYEGGAECRRSEASRIGRANHLTVSVASALHHLALVALLGRQVDGRRTPPSMRARRGSWLRRRPPRDARFECKRVCELRVRPARGASRCDRR